jgi:ribokinase
MRKPRIVVVGSSNTDMVIRADRIPSAGETILGGEFLMAAGGKGANQAVAAARLGGDVTLVARLGTDVFGDEALAGFRREGINTDYVVRDANSPSGVALILVDREGENVISVAPGANARLTAEDVLRAEPVIKGADAVLLQLEIPLETVTSAAKLARQSGVTVILNPAPAFKLDPDLLSCVDVLTPNQTETELLTGLPILDPASLATAGEELRRQGVTRVIITMGASGSFLLGDGKAMSVETIKVQAVDTTASGDAFNGALAVALAEGRETVDAVRFANLAGALAATRLGAQPSLPTRAELAQFERL